MIDLATMADAATALVHLPWDGGILLPLDGYDVPPTAPPGADKLLAVMGWLKWIGLFVCVAGLIIGGAMVAVSHRRGNGFEVARPVALAIIGAVIIGAASGLVGFFAT